MSTASNRRILLVDDNPAIHEDFRKILGGGGRPTAEQRDVKAAFFGTAEPEAESTTFELVSAYQGDEAIRLARESLDQQKPFALAFVDVRMPPGRDGVLTIKSLWEVDPHLQAVLCTAYSDYSWSEVVSKLGRNDRLLILKKPFDPVEVQQIASALSEKWNAERREKLRFDEARAAEQEARAYAASLVTVNRALESSRASAMAAARAKSEFLANMSHEVRTPMIAIIGHAEMLRDEDVDNGRSREHADVIHAQGTHLMSILSDVLDLAAIETGRLSVTKERCSLRAILSEIRDRFSAGAAGKGLALQVECADSVPSSIVSDPARLRQVISHLVGNAIKFTDSGVVRIAAALQRDHGGQAHKLKISVEDTGLGITPEQRSRLFEAFAQVDGSLTRRHGGAGLGLALSHQLAQKLGGSLDLESESGRGSRFTLSLALGDAEVQDATPSEPRRDARASDEGRVLRGRILLVEDVPATQRLYGHYLEKAGAQVDFADNGQTGVDRVLASIREGRTYDLVLMDMQMPVLDGYSATRMLRDRGFQGPIVAVTAHALTGDREKCLEAGCNDYCAKPADRKHLVALSREWIERSVPPALPTTIDEDVAPSSTSGSSVHGEREG